MSKFRTIAFLVCAFIAIAVSGDRAHAIDLYAFGSYWEPKDVDGSAGLGAGVSLPVITEMLMLDVRAYIFDTNDTDNNGEVDLLPIDVGIQAHLNPKGSTDLYLLAGASYVHADGKDFDVDSDFGGYAGVGLQAALGGPFKLFIEGVYRFVELDSDIDELEISGITGNAGIKFSF